MKVREKSLKKFHSFSEKNYERISSDSSQTVLLHYSGDLSEPHSNAITARLEKILNENLKEKKFEKRFFFVFLEVLQNIRLHGMPSEDGNVHGSCTIFKSKNFISGHFGNITSKKQSELLMRRYTEANSLSQPDLKKRYMEIMMNGEMSTKGGGGLGIITVVLRSKNPCEFNIHELSKEVDIFETTVKVDLKGI